VKNQSAQTEAKNEKPQPIKKWGKYELSEKSNLRRIGISG
jgi:hypothetical protein